MDKGVGLYEVDNFRAYRVEGNCNCRGYRLGFIGSDFKTGRRVSKMVNCICGLQGSQRWLTACVDCLVIALVGELRI